MESRQIFNDPDPVPRTYSAQFVNEMSAQVENGDYDWTTLHLYKNVVDFARNVNEYGYSRLLTELGCWESDNTSIKGVCSLIFGISVNGYILVPGKVEEWFSRSLLCPMNKVMNNDLTACVDLPPKPSFKERKSTLRKNHKKSNK